jgi:signal transduction histidine kinase
VKFTDHSGKVFIEALRDSGYIRITVRDTGIGLAEEEIGKLFRIDVKTKSIGPEKKEKGTGLGLILCKEFIEKNGGTIWVESKKGKGSCFHFTLPLIG